MTLPSGYVGWRLPLLLKILIVAIFYYIIGVAVSLAVAALGSTGLYGFRLIPSAWWTHWLGECVGIVIITSLWITWSLNSKLQWKNHAEVGEAVILLVLVFLAARVGFGVRLVSSHAHLPLAFLPIPFLVWAGLRLPPRAALSFVLPVASVAVYQTVCGLGPFGRGEIFSFLSLQLYLGLVFATVTMVVASVAHWKKIETELAGFKGILQETVHHQSGKLRSLEEQEILEISHREQQRIGQDLHDDLGQQLTGIAFLCKGIEQKLALKDLPEAGEMAGIGELIDDSITKVRSLARGLFPVELESKDIVTALQGMAAITEKMFNISCIFECEEPVSFRHYLNSVHLYRFAQEAVSNAIKHGKAGCVVIRLDRKKDKTILSVEDDGIGYVQEGENGNGIGLKIMNYRARMMQAEFNIRSQLKKGTVVTCSFDKNIL